MQKKSMSRTGAVDFSHELVLWMGGEEREGRGGPWEPQWYCEISSGRETETRSLMPMTKRTAARKPKGADWRSKARDSGCA